MGGFGIRKMHEINLALVAKLGWQFLHNPGKLWVSVAKAKYNNFSPLNPTSLSGNYSTVWKGILQAAPLLKLGLCL